MTMKAILFPLILSVLVLFLDSSAHLYGFPGRKKTPASELKAPAAGQNNHAGDQNKQSGNQKKSDEGQKYLSNEEYFRIMRDFSERPGHYFSSNYSSNESSYLQVIDEIEKLKIKGGAYIGVGPEQNYTYIAKIRPEIAFIVDIRQDAQLQHLMYRALFQISENRIDFIKNLTCRSPSRIKKDDSLEQSIALFLHESPPDSMKFQECFEHIMQTFREEDISRLSVEEIDRMKSIYRAFALAGLNISFDFRPNEYHNLGRQIKFHTLILSKTPDGRYENFLASDENYEAVRKLSFENRIVPIVGNFSGHHALRSIAEYLSERRIIVRVFYVSNVEAFLFQQNNDVRNYLENIYLLPSDVSSYMIRFTSRHDSSRPADSERHEGVTRMEKLQNFTSRQKKAFSSSYRELLQY